MRTEYNRVEMGEIVLSTEVARRIDPLAISLALRRHSFGRWGKLSPVERAINDHGGSRGVFSIHETRERTEFWIITAAGTCSILVLSSEIEARLNQAWEMCFDEYGYSDEREFEKCRWNAVKDRLDWNLNSPMELLREYSALEAKRYEDCSTSQHEENRKNFRKPEHGMCQAGFHADWFFQVTSDGLRRDYLKIRVESCDPSGCGCNDASIFQGALLLSKLMGAPQNGREGDIPERGWGWS
jgi:hypothetical protein